MAFWMFTLCGEIPSIMLKYCVQINLNMRVGKLQFYLSSLEIKLQVSGGRQLVLGIKKWCRAAQTEQKRTFLKKTLSLVTAFSSKSRWYHLSGQKEMEIRMGEFMTRCYLGCDWDGEKKMEMIKISCVETFWVIFITHLYKVQLRWAHKQ